MMQRDVFLGLLPLTPTIGDMVRKSQAWLSLALLVVATY